MLEILRKMYGLRLNYFILSSSTLWIFWNVTEAYETNVSFLVQLVPISVVFQQQNLNNYREYFH